MECKVVKTLSELCVRAVTQKWVHDVDDAAATCIMYCKLLFYYLKHPLNSKSSSTVGFVKGKKPAIVSVTYNIRKVE
jgi:hypothetical protein